jgi:nitrite reductase/ring-hydroxylating ferredoxin subunit
MREELMFFSDFGREHIGRRWRGACRSRRCEGGLYSENQRSDLANEFVDVTGKKEEGIEMGFVRAAKMGEVPPGTIREVHVEGKAIALANVGGQFHAIDNTCIHRGGPLADGPLEGNTVTCPWHGWEYDVRTGKVGQNPTAGVDCYAVEVRGDEVFVKVGD